MTKAEALQMVRELVPHAVRTGGRLLGTPIVYVIPALTVFDVLRSHVDPELTKEEINKILEEEDP